MYVVKKIDCIMALGKEKTRVYALIHTGTHTFRHAKVTCKHTRRNKHSHAHVAHKHTRANKTNAQSKALSSIPV